MLELQSLRWRMNCAVSYRLRALQHGRFAVHCRPTSIIFLMSERCNSRCTHCDIWKNRGKEEDIPTFEQWKKVLDDIRHWLGPAQVTLSGGEALLRRDTPDILRHGSSIGLMMELLSHGYWPDAKRMEQVAKAKPWRVTISLDGVGESHNTVRGRPDFWSKTSASIDTLLRMRAQESLHYKIQLKTVVMRQNFEAVTDIARFAGEKGVDVFYQPIEQNYNTEADPLWYEKSPNFPPDRGKVVQKVDELIALQEQGLPIRNSRAQLEVMKNYFQDPGGLSQAVQGHSAHEGRQLCSGIIGLQIQANGDVRNCSRMPTFGNIRETPIRELWRNRPQYWLSGCCLNSPPVAGDPSPAG
jgi:MoaA/NifB/PqqE/SkfB family radical SAM enzyme